MWAGTFTMIRLGFGAYMRCPVGNHWVLVRPATETDLTQEERQILKLREHLDDQDGVKLNSSIGLLIGLIGLVGWIVFQNWWWALFAATWVLVWGAVFMHASRKGRPAAPPN
ncbi:MAG TPA: hypothetical protein VMU73_03655 [Gaiellaceae bacterium]|nr:hypothetical protein [Gaiellaceae bacterium]